MLKRPQPLLFALLISSLIANAALFFAPYREYTLEQTPKTINENEGATTHQDQTEAPLVFRVLLPGGIKTISTYCNSYGEDEKKKWPQSYYCDLKITDVYIAVFTGLLTLVTAGLIVVGIKQAKLSRDAFIADKRAFVFASRLNAFYEPDAISGNFNWRMGVAWQNSGDTPTRGLRLYSDGFLSETAISPFFDFTQLDPVAMPGTGMLGPKVTSGAGNVPHLPRPPLTPQDVIDIQSGTKFFYLWGWARYFDTLPNTEEHITRFCWRILIVGDPLSFNPAVDPNSVRFSNSYEHRGNCADEECALQGLG